MCKISHTLSAVINQMIIASFFLLFAFCDLRRPNGLPHLVACRCDLLLQLHVVALTCMGPTCMGPACMGWSDIYLIGRLVLVGVMVFCERFC